MRLLGMPRFTMDWDVYIPPKDEENIRKINDLLDDVLDLPVVSLGPAGENFVQTYQTPWGILQFLLGAPGLPSFEEAEKHTQLLKTENNTEVRVLANKHLLSCKEATARPKDKEDIKYLRLLRERPKQ